MAVASDDTNIVYAENTGKSLLRSLNRLVAPTSGVIQVDGLEVTEASAPGLRRKLNYPAASAVLLVLIAVVMLVDLASSRLRAKLV